MITTVCLNDSAVPDFKEATDGMDRAIYRSDGVISLCEYIDAMDDIDCYRCWQDEETQQGYNHETTETFDEFAQGSIRSRFMATVVRNADRANVGVIFLSSEGTLPDLAIMIYRPYRKKGYATRAFSLGVAYCFDAFKLDRIYAGCYPHNAASLKMLRRCGFQPHPEGNQQEKHFRTGEDITQMDFVITNPSHSL